MNTTTWTVEGMTCQHCVTSVTNEVSAVAGVTSVKVDLEHGAVDVVGDGVDSNRVIAAIAEAGYEAQPA